jgi:transglutaminase-like putative cysteine protease
LLEVRCFDKLRAKVLSKMLGRPRIEEGWFTLALVWAMVLIAAAAILNAELIDGLEVLPLISTVAVIAGLLLAKSRFSSRTAHLLAIIYGVFLVTFLMGRSLPGDLPWNDRVGDLIYRQLAWLNKAITQRSSRDGLIFVIHTSAVFWLLGYTAAWYTFRKPRIWRVVLPSGLVLLSVIYYYYGPKPLAGFLALYALVGLVYIARTHLVARERLWRSSSVRYEKGIRSSFLQASFLAALVALGLAWGLPTAEASTTVSNAFGETGIGESWRGFQDNWTRLFSSLRTYGTGTSDNYRETLSLGGPRSVGNTLIMDVYVPKRLPFVYWQAVAYDTYQDGTWSIADNSRVLHLPDEGKLGVPYAALREEVNQTFINFVPNSGTIYAAPEIVGSDRQIYVDHSSNSDGDFIVHSVQSRFIMRQGDQYEVTSRYSYADATSLRQASRNYPDWIEERYLQVPESITPETIALAETLTAGLENPFDKAIAIRDYLRSNIAYNDQIQAAPEDVEPIHYILFDRPEAYCNYYASAMIMMLRSQGVPARFVAGYAQGEWNEETRSYRVRASNAHAWADVYFPGYGWIQFEPTAALPVGERPESGGNPGDAFGNIAADNEGLGPDGFGPGDNLSDNERLADLLAEQNDLSQAEALGSGGLKLWQVSGAIVLLGVAVVASAIGARFNQRVESSVERSYGRLGNWANWLGVLILPAHTPYERADILASVVPEGKVPLRNITRQFVRQRFSPQRSSDDDFDPRAEWKVLRPLILRRMVAHQLERLRSRKED